MVFDQHPFGGGMRNAVVTSPVGRAALLGFVAFASARASGQIYLGVHGFGVAIASAATAGQTYLRRHDFDATDGPVGAPAVDQVGNLYGASQSGGSEGSGYIWKMTPSGVFTHLHDFGGTLANADGSGEPDGAEPEAGVTIDSGGNLFGTTRCGGRFKVAGVSAGIVWEISAGGQFRDLHDFGGTVTNANGQRGPDGRWPTTGVTVDPRGDLYGTTPNGGPNDPAHNGGGVLWEITAARSYVDLHDFADQATSASGRSFTDGAGPAAEVTIDSAETVYGTAFKGAPQVRAWCGVCARMAGTATSTISAAS